MRAFAVPAAACAALFLASAAPPAPALAAQAPAAQPATEAGRPQHLPTETLTFRTAHGPRTFRVQVADTDATRELGLMFVRAMPQAEGMVFDFPAAGPQAFWMHNTYIPLDIVYVGPDGRVLSIAKQAKPLDDSPLPSGGSARAVVELNGGVADKLGIAPGDRVTDARIFPAH